MTGHCTEEMTEHYTHLLEEDYTEIRKVQEDVFGNSERIEEHDKLGEIKESIVKPRRR